MDIDEWCIMGGSFFDFRVVGRVRSEAEMSRDIAFAGGSGMPAGAESWSAPLVGGDIYGGIVREYWIHLVELRLVQLREGIGAAVMDGDEDRVMVLKRYAEALQEVIRYEEVLSDGGQGHGEE